jgi:hypothetical protein
VFFLVCSCGVDREQDAQQGQGGIQGELRRLRRQFAPGVSFPP